MKKSMQSLESHFVRQKLIDMRKSAGLTQRELADRMNREQSFIWRLESGERRLDLIEFYWICSALGQDASKLYSQIIRDISSAANN
ncbi:MAG: helix-turn-helix domain-containing protein, partial [Kiritimatiellia bacterium]